MANKFHAPKPPKQPGASAPKLPTPPVAPNVQALGRPTGNFARIAATQGKGAAIGALQNTRAKERGQPIPYRGGRRGQ